MFIFLFGSVVISSLSSLKTIIEIKPETERHNVFRDEKNENTVFEKGYEKYGFAAEAYTKNKNYIYMIVFGDPYAAFPALGNHAECNSDMFFEGECMNHVLCKYTDEFKDCYCEKGQETVKCSECNNYEIATHDHPIFISSIGPAWVLGNGTTLFSDVNDNLFTVPFHWTINADKAGFDSVSEEVKTDWNNFKNAQIKARQARFEHGETPTF